VEGEALNVTVDVPPPARTAGFHDAVTPVGRPDADSRTWADGLALTVDTLADVELPGPTDTAGGAETVSALDAGGTCADGLGAGGPAGAQAAARAQRGMTTANQENRRPCAGAARRRRD